MRRWAADPERMSRELAADDEIMRDPRVRRNDATNRSGSATVRVIPG